MENVVPGALQRLRAADIIRMAGLNSASLGQEYNRTATIRDTQRQGMRLRGKVDVSQSDPLTVALDDNNATTADDATAINSFSVEVEILNSAAWVSSCSCDGQGSLLCAHSAALLYHWLAQPTLFTSVSVPDEPDTIDDPFLPTSVAPPKRMPAREVSRPESLLPQNRLLPASTAAVRYSPDLVNILGQLSLSELRGIAREYNLLTNGVPKPQLAEMIFESIKQPEGVRRIATTIEKAQRQLLAALSLAGGIISDDDVHGLFERFGLGQPAQLQQALLALQRKALLFHVNAPVSEIPLRVTHNSNLASVDWFVPVEVRSALRVLVPVTPFDVFQVDEKYGLPQVQSAQSYRILSDLLQVARALNGVELEMSDPWSSMHVNTSETSFSGHIAGSSSTEHNAHLLASSNLPSEALLDTLQKKVPFTRAFARFAVCVLIMAGIVQKPERDISYLRTLPNAAHLLLGSVHADVLSDLFQLWLQSASSTELFALLEEGVQIRYRMSSQNVPMVRASEIAEENKEARQIVMTLLSQAPTQQWMSFAAFARFVYRLNPLFLQRRQYQLPTPHWWLETEASKALKPAHLGDWQRAEQLYLAQFIAGPLHWWGLCEIALSVQGRLLAFKLTDLAAWLLHTGSVDAPLSNYPEAESSQAALQVVDNEHVLVACTAQFWPTIELLETFAEVAGVTQGRLHYHFTPQVLSDALSKGARPDRLLEILRALADAEKQPNSPCEQLLAQLERWIASYGRVRIYTGVTMLEAADTTVMRELSATTTLDAYVIRQLHPTLLVVDKEAVGSITEDLKRRGQSPLIHEEELYGSE
jgi:Helicase conserved C-terminal domain